MSDIVWGEPIEANTQPDWLGDNELIIVKWHSGEWTNITYGIPAVHWVHTEWGAFKLPANHPYYLATSTGFKYWPGGDCAPDDWDGGKVLLRDGDDTGSGEDWRHLVAGCDIIGYKPKSIYSDGVVTPEDVRANITKPKFIAPKRCAGVTYDEYMDQLATAFQNWVNGDIVEEEPADHLLEIAQNIAADVCRDRGDNPPWVQYMREGAHNSDREVQIALAALKRGMEMR